jgi:hypothetical protein
MIFRQRPRIALVTADAVLPADTMGRRRVNRLWRALSARGVVTPIVIGDTPPPAFRAWGRDIGAVFLPVRHYDTGALRRALEQGRRDIVTPGLAEIRDGEDLPDWLWPRLSEAEALSRHVLNPRRLHRILHRLRRLAPALVVLGDAALAPLAPHLVALGWPVVLAPAETDQPGETRWVMARQQALGAAMRLAAPHLAQLWLPGGGETAGLTPDRVWLLPADEAALQDTLGAALRSLGFKTGAPRQAFVPQDAEAGIVDATIRFHPHTRLLTWRFGLRLAGPEAAVSVAWMRDGLPLEGNAFVTLLPAAGGIMRAMAVAILPDGLPATGLALRVERDGQVLDRPVPARVPLEAAGLLHLEPDGAGFAVRGWSDAPRTLLWPDVPLSQLGAPAGAAILAGRLEALDGAALRIAPRTASGQEAGLGQALANPAHWVVPRRPSTLRLAALRDRHQGETAWLLGNGPSVRLADLDALEGRLTFGFNRFHLAHRRTRLRPTYTVTGDRQMIEDFGQEIVGKSGGTVFVAHEVPPELTGDYIWLRQLAIDPPLFSLGPEQVVSPGGSSVFVALQLAHFMGVRRCYLYGTDFSFTFAQPAAGPDPFRAAVGEGNHFIADYRGGRPWCPPSLRDIAAGFHIAGQVMAADGGFIRNASHGGLLEIFPREDFASALQSGGALSQG